MLVDATDRKSPCIVQAGTENSFPWTSILPHPRDSLKRSGCIRLAEELETIERQTMARRACAESSCLILVVERRLRQRERRDSRERSNTVGADGTVSRFLLRESDPIL